MFVNNIIGNTSFISDYCPMGILAFFREINRIIGVHWIKSEKIGMEFS